MKKVIVYNEVWYLEGTRGTRAILKSLDGTKEMQVPLIDVKELGDS